MRPKHRMKPAEHTLMLLPAQRGTCPECAVKHPPDAPHDQQSLYYQMKFQAAHKRWPTWADAMAHCTPGVKAQWTRMLETEGVSV